MGVVQGTEAQDAIDEHTRAKWDMRHAFDRALEAIEGSDCEAHAITGDRYGRKVWAVIVVRGAATEEMMEAVNKLMDRWDNKR